MELYTLQRKSLVIHLVVAGLVVVVGNCGEGHGKEVASGKQRRIR